MKPDQMATVFAEIVKVDDNDDGTVYVTGSVSDDTVDIDKQIADKAWLKSAIPNWFSTGGNVREMHQPIAAGIATEYDEADGKHQIKALVVDEGSVRKVKAGVLKGFSIGIKGPRVIVDKAAQGGRIVGGQVIEVSLVDRPANPTCTLTLAKAATPGMEVIASGIDEERGLVKVEELHETETELPTPAPEETVDAPPVETISVAGGGQPAPEVVEPEQLKLDLAAMTDERFDILKRDFSTEQRRRMAARGQAMPGGGFPIANAEDLENAIRLAGNAKDPAAARTHIEERARALNRADLIPATWKGVEPDLTKRVGATEERAHDPEVLAQVRNGLLQCLIAEAQEALGGESEQFDLETLIQTLGLFMTWWRHEAYEDEAPHPMTVKTVTPDEPVQVSPSPDEPEDATLSEKNAMPDTVKALIAEAVKAAEGALIDKFDQLTATVTARLATVEKMAAPGGPVRTRTKAASISAHRGDQIRTEIANLKATQAGLSDRALAGAYGEMILQKTAELGALEAVADAL